MSPVREKLLRLLAQMSERYPDWRFGELVANATAWAVMPTEPDETGIWDVEDEVMLAAIERHLQRSRDGASGVGTSARD